MNSPPAALMDRLAALLGEPSGDAEELAGGITNRNYRVRLGGGDYVVRITSPGIVAARHRPPLRACRAAVAAAALGVAPRVAAFLEDAGCLVTEFLPAARSRRRSCASRPAHGSGTHGSSGA